MKAAVFLLSAAVLAHEVCLLRALTIAYHGHAPALVVSVALLGFGFAGTLLARVAAFRRAGAFPVLAALYAAAIPASLLVARGIDFNLLQVGWEPREWLRLLALQAVFALPFTLGALALYGAIAREADRPGRIYAANLLGSGAGALASGGLLALGPPESAMRVAALAAAFAAAGGGRGRLRLFAIVGFVAVLLSGGLRLAMSPFKDLAAAPDKTWLALEHGPRGRIDRVHVPSLHAAPGLSLLATAPLPPQDGLYVDGNRVAAVDRGPSDYYRQTVDALPLVLAGSERTVLLGVGPGLAHADFVVEADPALLALTGVEGVARPPRAWLARPGPPVDLLRIEASAQDPLREDPLLTVEGLAAALDRVGPGGQVAITTFLETPPRRGARLLAMADRVTPHVVALRSVGRLCVVLRHAPPSAEAARRLVDFAARHGFDIVRPADLAFEEPFHATATPLEAPGADYPYDVSPTTDARPYFHRFFRFDRLGDVFDRRFVPFVEWAFVAHLMVLLQMTLLAGLLLFVPLVRLPAARAPALLFLALGMAFMLAEMAWIGLATVRTGSATLATAAVLGGFLVGSGMGSLVGERWGRPLRRAAFASALAPLALGAVLPVSPVGIGLLAAVAAFPLGMPFPAALARLRPNAVPWALAWNGFASVIAAAAAPILSSTVSLPATAFVAAALYLAVALLSRRRDLAGAALPSGAGSTTTG